MGIDNLTFFLNQRNKSKDKKNTLDCRGDCLLLSVYAKLSQLLSSCNLTVVSILNRRTNLSKCQTTPLQKSIPKIKDGPYLQRRKSG